MTMAQTSPTLCETLTTAKTLPHNLKMMSLGVEKQISGIYIPTDSRDL